MRAVARAHDVSLSTVQWWCRRAGELPLDRVDWSDRPPIAARVLRTASAVEDLVLGLRRELISVSTGPGPSTTNSWLETTAWYRRCEGSGASSSDVELSTPGTGSVALHRLGGGTFPR